MSTSRYRRILSPPFITNFDQSWKQLLSCLDSPAGLPDDIPHPMTHNPVSLALNHQDSVPLSQRAKQTCLCVRDNREISKALEQVKVEKKSIDLLSFNRADLKNMLIVNYAVRILDIVYARLCFCLLSFFLEFPYRKTGTMAIVGPLRSYNYIISLSIKMSIVLWWDSLGSLLESMQKLFCFMTKQEKPRSSPTS